MMTRVTPRVLNSVFIILILLFILFSLAPAFYEISRTGDLHPERQFELVHNFPTDYNFYLSRIREGLEGRWTVVEKYTSEPHAGSFMHEFYLLMGQVGRFVRVPLHRAGDIYHIARIVLGAVLLTVIAGFCSRSFSGRRQELVLPGGIVAFLLAVTASSFPKLVAVIDNQVIPATFENVMNWRFGGYMAWWSMMDSLQRITFIPHILVGQALIVLMVLGLVTGSLFRTTAHALFFGVAAFVLGSVFPPGLIFVYAVYGVWGLSSFNRFKEWRIPMTVVALVSAPSLLQLALMTSFYPWKRLAEVDIIRPLPFTYDEYVRAMGPILPLGLAGLVAAFIRNERRLLPAVSWILAWILLLVVFSFIPQQSPLRFSEMAPQVPLAVLTAYLLGLISRPRVLGTWLAAILIGAGLIHMHSSYLWQRDFVDHKIRATLPLVPTGSFVMYPLKDFLNAMWYIHDQTKGEGVVLSGTTAGNYIPVISGNTVYVGHDNTVAFEAKKELVKTFFAGRMPVDQAQGFVRQARASFVFFGPQEREDGGLTDLNRMYPFLTEAYKNAYVTVYKTP